MLTTLTNTNSSEKLAIDPASLRVMPHNLPAEQVLLGALLTNNELLNRISDFLLAEHFFEPIHQKIFQAIVHFSEKGVIATPVTLRHFFEKEEALVTLGGPEYLVKLASLSTTIINVLDYAKTIYDLSLRRQLIDIGEQVVNTAFETKINLPAIEQIEEAEQKLFVLSAEGNKDKSFQPIKHSLSFAIQKTELAFKHKEKVTGTSTKFIDLDNLLGGLQNSDLLILAGRPSMGKTALAINLAVNCCESLFERSLSKNPEAMPPAVGFFSLEMSSEQLAARMLSLKAEISSGKLRSGQIDQDDFSKVIQASRTLERLPFFIDDTPALSIAALRTRARRLKRRHNLGLLVIDYLQLVRGVSKGGDSNRVQEVSEITQGLKAIAKELDIPVIALSQLSRAVESREDKRPLLSDLRESGSIEQDADIVMFIFREEYYVARKEPREGTTEYDVWQDKMNQVQNISEIIIAKQRNGPIGNVRLRFDASTTRFDNFTEDYK